MSKNMKRIMQILFAVYGVLMLWLLFASRGGGLSEINLIPLKTIRKFWDSMLQSFGTGWGEALFVISFINLVGNIVMFVPLGFFPPFVWKPFSGFWADMALCAAVITAVEILQFVTGLGYADIDDFILNIVGAAIGWLVFSSFRKASDRAITESN